MNPVRPLDKIYFFHLNLIGNFVTAIEVSRTSTGIYPHSSIVGIKTNGIKTPLDLTRVLAQTFFSQTPYLYVGYHSYGSFQRIDKIETRTKFPEWERENEVVLKKMVVLLRKIRNVVQNIEGRRASLIFEIGKGEDGIKVYHRKGKQALLPDDLLQRWD